MVFRLVRLEGAQQQVALCGLIVWAKIRLDQQKLKRVAELWGVMNEFQISVFTNDYQKPLSKRIQIDQGGNLSKSAAAHLSSGFVETKNFASLEKFGEFMMNLPAHKAVSFGISKYKKARVLSQHKAQDYSGDETIITRTRENFSWSNEVGVLVLDYDPKPDTQPLDQDQLVETLRLAVPELTSTTLISKPSASSCIYYQDQEKRGVAGQHVFMLCDDAVQIPSIGDLIYKRLWLNGHGYIRISGSGSLLERTIIDASVWQPERLVFGRADCAAGLIQKFPTLKIYSSNK